MRSGAVEGVVPNAIDRQKSHWMVGLLSGKYVPRAVPLNRDDWSYRHVWQIQGVIYVIGLIWAKRRYDVHD